MASLVLNLAGEIIDISTKSVLSICQIMIFCRRKGDPEGGPDGIQKGSTGGPDGGPIGRVHVLYRPQAQRFVLDFCFEKLLTSNTT